MADGTKSFTFWLDLEQSTTLSDMVTTVESAFNALADFDHIGGKVDSHDTGDTRIRVTVAKEVYEDAKQAVLDGGWDIDSEDE